MRSPFFLKILLSLLIVLGCGACGYHREGQLVAASGRQNLYIELFANDTHRAFANDLLTVQVINRFARSPHFMIVEDPAQADLLLGGAITRYETAPIAYSRLDAISAYKAEFSMRAALRRPGAAREVIWRSTLSTSQDYTGNNPDLVLEESAERLANDLYVQITDELFWKGGE